MPREPSEAADEPSPARRTPSWIRGLAALLPRLIVTLVVVSAAAWGVNRLWQRYEVRPWTRDGRVRVKTVELAPDVSGLVDRVLVKDNERVQTGELLFTIDTDRFQLALRQAEATLVSAQAAAAEARRESSRNHALTDLVASETVEQGDAKAAQAFAAVLEAKAAVDQARLNLRRSMVYSPANGYLSDLLLQQGDYASVGHPVLAIVDSATLHVEGYFEETKLAGVHIGQPALVRLMGEPRPLFGHVESIAAAIDDRDRAEAPNLLPNVNPTFSWVRLAQRVPVWITIDRAPAGVLLIPGRTASVEILTPPARRQNHDMK